MKSNQVFYNFLKLSCPVLSNTFKKKGEEIYETYLPLNKQGHKFIYDSKQQTITHIFFQTTYNGYEYGKKMITKVFDITLTDNGFTAKERLCI